MTALEVQEILSKHEKWLNHEDGGERANLRGANLSGANLRGADLRGADLRGANLSGADLSGANLIGANLIGADLIWANISGANLSGANLSGANLRCADLRGANLSGANLSGANLISAELDFSCLPLWCGGALFKCSPKLIRQIFAHVSTLVCEDADDELKAALDAIKGEAMKSHRAHDLGLKGEVDD